MSTNSHHPATDDQPTEAVGMHAAAWMPAAQSAYAAAPRWRLLGERAVATAPSRQAGPNDRLAAVEGLDLDVATRYVGGHPPLLMRVLRRFVATYRQGMPALLDASGDEHELVLRWRTACHSVRGALAMVGATSLVQEVSGLERALGELAPRASLGAKGLHIHEGLMALVGRLALALED